MFTIKIQTKRKESAQKIINLLSVFSKMGHWGASRGIITDWDGDGPDTIDIVESSGLEPNLEEGFLDGRWVGITYKKAFKTKPEEWF